MNYGIRCTNQSGDSVTLSYNIVEIIDTGTITMPNYLNIDGTYGIDIDLPGAEDIDISRIGVSVFPTKFTYDVNAFWTYWSHDGRVDYMCSFFADDEALYYSKHPSTGVMNVWNAGNMTRDLYSESEWDAVCSVYPLAGWDFLDSETTFRQIRLWAATAHIIYDYSASLFRTVYQIGTNGVSEISYMIFLKGDTE